MDDAQPPEPPLLLLPAPRQLLLLPAPREGLAPPGPSSASRLIREIVETSLLAILVFLCVRASFGTYQVEGHSMDPTLQDGEFLIVNQLTYARIDTNNLSDVVPGFPGGKHDVFGGPGRGDIIILHNPQDPAGKRLVKRIIGLPGELIETTGGEVRIDGHPLEEPYIHITWRVSGPSVVCPAESYYVMGDNRDNSSDSRVFGCVPHDLLIGKATISLWPSDRFGLAPNKEPTLR